MAAFSLTTIQSAFATYLTAAASAASAKATVTALGAFPLFPLEITTNTDYSNVATAQATWLGSYATANATYQSALATQRADELLVIAAIVSVTTSSTTPAFGANEWYIHSDAAHWFGYSATDVSKVDGQQYLIVETTLPTKPFVNSVS